MINHAKATPFFSLLILRRLRQMSVRRPLNSPTTGSKLRQMELQMVASRGLARGRNADAGSQSSGAN